MDLNFRFVIILAALLYLSRSAAAGGILHEEMFKGCTKFLLDKCKSHIFGIECAGLKVLENFTEYVPAGGQVTELHSFNTDFAVLEDFYKMGLLQLRLVQFVIGKIERIEDGAFKGGETIRELYLSSNYIQSLDPAVFRFLPNLEKLYLDRNNIKQFEVNSFFPNENLQVLSLSNNQLESLNLKLFSKLNKLDSLRICGNQLSKLDVRFFTQGLPELSDLALDRNPWECNCEFMVMMKFLQGKKNMFLDSNSGNLASCTGQNYNISIRYLKEKVNWTNLSYSCTPEVINQLSQKEIHTEEIKLNATEKNLNEKSESNHFGLIFLIILVIGMVGFAGVGVWIKKRATPINLIEDDRAKIVEGNQDFEEVQLERIPSNV